MRDQEEKALKIRLFYETYLEAQQLIFQNMKAQNPVMAEKLRPHFEEYMQIEASLVEEDKEGVVTFDDVRKRIPNNLWVQILSEYAEDLPESTEENLQESQLEFRKRIERRKRGLDTN